MLKLRWESISHSVSSNGNAQLFLAAVWGAAVPFPPTPSFPYSQTDFWLRLSDLWLWTCQTCLKMFWITGMRNNCLIHPFLKTPLHRTFPIPAPPPFTAISPFLLPSPLTAMIKTAANITFWMPGKAHHGNLSPAQLFPTDPWHFILAHQIESLLGILFVFY